MAGTLVLTTAGTIAEAGAAGMESEKVKITRLLAIPINILTSPLVGILRNVFYKLLKVEKPEKLPFNEWTGKDLGQHLVYSAKATLVDYGLFFLTQLPIYYGILKLAGATKEQTAAALLFAVYTLIPVARITGFSQDISRIRIFDVPPAGVHGRDGPQSPQE